ncbi:MAG: UpxY family transcription antiterminator [Candidatus Angelobacter sp.]
MSTSCNPGSGTDPSFTVFPNPGNDVLQKQCWYAVYTRTRHEKAVAEQCKQRGVIAFLPLYCVRHRWKQRFAEVLLPLFPSYIFVRIALEERVRVLSVPGIVSIVSFNGSPAVVPESQIDCLKRAISLGRAEPHAYLRSGRKVRVTAGPLIGLEGIVVEIKNRMQVIVSFEWMCRSVAISLDPADIGALC